MVHPHLRSFDRRCLDRESRLPTTPDRTWRATTPLRPRGHPDQPHAKDSIHWTYTRDPRGGSVGRRCRKGENSESLLSDDAGIELTTPAFVLTHAYRLERSSQTGRSSRKRTSRPEQVGRLGEYICKIPDTADIELTRTTTSTRDLLPQTMRR